MRSNRPCTVLAIILTAYGLALAVTSMCLHRRRMTRGAAGEPAKDRKVETGTGDEDHFLAENLLDDQGAHKDINANSSQGNLILKYFLVVLVLCIPFWLVGGNKLPLPVNLPVSAFAFTTPMIAASIFLYKRDRLNGVRELLKRTFDYRKNKNNIWFLPALLLMPLIYSLSYAVMRLTGLPLPDPEIPILMAPVFFFMYFIAATGEELGWSGYAIDLMQKRWGALKASIILGLVWGIVHIIGDVQAHHPAKWILWQRLYSVALRILIVWIYNNSGKSVFAAILVHTMDNVCWSLFPNYGSGYNPFVTSMITWLTAIIAIFLWGPKTLARYKYARVSRF